MASFPVASRFTTSIAFALLLAGAITPGAAMAESTLPDLVKALLPAGATLGESSWDVMETEFGITFGGHMVAEEFQGKKPSCAFGPTTEFRIDLQGDTAFDQPPMLDMALAQFQQDIESTQRGMGEFVANYVKAMPDIVSVGAVQRETLAGGEVVYVDMVEDCASHPKGVKTMLQGTANRGATRVEFKLVASLDAAGAKALAEEIFRNFAALDTATLTQ